MAGIAAWLYAQADEERGHMLKFIKYVNERGGSAVIPEFKKPPVKYKGIPELFAEVLKHEKFITASISEVLETAIAEKDHATANWIQWFVKEQVEEESSAQLIFDRQPLAENTGIYFLDRDIMNSGQITITDIYTLKPGPLPGFFVYTLRRHYGINPAETDLY